MQCRRPPSFLGVAVLRHTLPQLPATLEAAAVIAAVMGFGLGWAWLVSSAQPANTAYPGVAMSTPESTGSSPHPAPITADDEALPQVEEWLIDGFNLLHTTLLGGEERTRWWTASGRGRVLEAVAGATHVREHPHVWVVFDGSRPVPTESTGRLHAVFAPSADDWLVHRIRAAEEPGRIVVVTADRRLANRARHHGAVVLNPGDFLAREV
ncbi:MAG: NYN domain-containing protein [Myxococcota bacterium]|nr:NYN domain-containing protein [Myxococcota bacterium]